MWFQEVILKYSTNITISDLRLRLGSDTIKALDCLRSWLKIKDSEIEALIRAIEQISEDQDLLVEKRGVMTKKLRLHKYKTASLRPVLPYSTNCKTYIVSDMALIIRYGSNITDPQYSQYTHAAMKSISGYDYFVALFVRREFPFGAFKREV